MHVTNIKDKLITERFYEMIKNCNTLRKVRIHGVHHIEACLEVIETNKNVKQWELEVHSKDITPSIKNRINSMLSKRNDNSLIIEGDNISEHIPLITQLFEVSPVSDC